MPATLSRQSASPSRREFCIDAAIVVALVLIAAVSRVAFDRMASIPPNFHLTAGCTLLAGILVRRPALAWLVGPAAMTLSDLVIGAYQPTLMLAVYACMALPMLFSGWFRDGGKCRRSAGAAVLGLGAAATLSAVIYFVVVNAAVWAVTPWFTKDISGFVRCYVAAVPFLKWMWISNMASMFAGAGLWLALTAPQRAAAAALSK